MEMVGQDEVPGCACGAPNITMAAPGRVCSRQTAEVNFPDIVENSYTQQEETKPSFRDSKNRLLLSQVAYFQNYQLKTDNRKDDEEQKYRDNKNKLFLSQVAYYLGCRLKTEVSGFLCCAPKVNMVASGRPPSRRIPEENITEGIEKSGSQQEENKSNVGASKNRLLLSQVAYFQNYRLKSYKAQEDDDEERRYRDNKNKLLVSQAVYSLACQLKMEVPVFLCSAPNVIMVASGRAVARTIPGVNVPEAIEKFCSQREDNKPDVGVSQNRCLLSEVNYFLNYRLRTYEAQEDDDEEWRYGDNKNKFLVSQAIYYLVCQLKMEVPGFPCSALNVITVASGRAVAGTILGVNVPEAIEKSCSQREDKPDVGVRRNRFLLSEVNYSLNYRLRTYEAREDDDEERRYGDSKNKLCVSQAVYYLVCQLKTEVPGFPFSSPNVITVASGRAVAGKIPGVNVPEAIEKFCSQREDNKPDVGVRRNRCLLSEVDYSLNYRLRAYDDQKDHNEEQKYRDNKNKHLMSQAAYYLDCRLKTEENDKDKDEDVHVAEAEKIQESPAPREVRKLEVKKVPEDSLEESVITHLNSYGPTDSSQPHRDTNEETTFDEDSIDSGLVVQSASSDDVAEDALIILTEDRKDDDEEQKYRACKNKLLMCQVAYYLGCRLKTEVPGFRCTAPNVNTVASGRPPRKIPEMNVPEGIEKSCSQREESKPSVGAIKKRLLLSLVAYFLKYRLKSYKDRKDDDEEQKYRDCKNKLLMCQVAYYLGCRLKTEVPGFWCTAPNVHTVASGRPPSRTIPEVQNVPEGIEKSCSQREESKPNVGAIKKRLLLSLVAYFLKYRLKSYKDRKDDDEEQKYRDCKNKLLMCQVAYYLGCRLKTEVPGFRCAAPKVNTVASCRPPFRTIPEVQNVPEGIEKSSSKREESKPNVGAIKKRLLLSLVAYFLKYRLKSYKDCKDHNEEQKYRDCKNKLLMCQVAYYLGCRLKTEDDQKDLDEEQKYRDSKNKHLMSQAAYYLYCRLKTEENDKDKDEDVHVAEAEKIQESPAPREVQKVEVKKVPEDSLEESVITHSKNSGPTDPSQPHRDTSEIKFEEDSVASVLAEESASSHDVAEDALIILSESQGDVEEEEEKGPVPPRNLQESVEEEAPQESWDEGDSTLSVPPGPSAFNETLRSNLHSLEEQQVISAVDIDKIKNDDEEEDQGPPCPRLSMELVEAEEPEVFRYSLDVLYSTYTAYPEFCYTGQAYTYVIFLFVEEHVRLTLDMDSRFLTTTVTRLPLVSRVGVIFPH
uniref:neuroblastoma breakpoint family member 1 n=1 Tax=Callithrix jacchus TaxID=9483 RepID=UPI0023DD135D|nr:neuroblastoma breakpoint family member 1 [Callithrix jacchus]XP_054103889.1 neuroblastoma breakpoint family member 1 [Callithrix jacchus]XP_054103890.1 neuroblastoma breakpoint family member 1 [Callithrix jacchus]XP_054103891.1 neuroblastoma breakpoint family member 1 [Callithrix jacchus]XP_054103892.1 neuroblastoma breakpoint family member 1 [Callithrix jacchus]XP_054103893.1 neuroblastoma breakpoint family member 1 [Callithrix jacchus]XP_054103894.1 neuroblastoma breakpoint family member